MAWWSESKESKAAERERERLTRENAALRAEEEKWDGVPLEDIRCRDIEKNQRESAAQADAAQRQFIAKFCRDNPFLVDDENNRDVLIVRINALVRESGREYANWGPHDFKIAMDAAADANELHCRGPYQRQSFTEAELNAMSQDELRMLAVDQLSGPKMIR